MQTWGEYMLYKLRNTSNQVSLRVPFQRVFGTCLACHPQFARTEELPHHLPSRSLQFIALYFVEWVSSRLTFNTKYLNFLTENHTGHRLSLTHTLGQKHFLIYHVFPYSLRPPLVSLKIIPQNTIRWIEIFWRPMKSIWITKHIGFNFLAIKDQMSKIY